MMKLGDETYSIRLDIDQGELERALNLIDTATRMLSEAEVYLGHMGVIRMEKKDTAGEPGGAIEDYVIDPLRRE